VQVPELPPSCKWDKWEQRNSLKKMSKKAQNKLDQQK
jgi:hypothetical protein